MIQKIPKHIAIIPDGNRRWAKEHQLQTFLGHHKGYEKIKTIPKYFFDRGVKVVSFFVFSTENWSRSEQEVDYLMNLLKKAFTEDLDDLIKQGIKLLISGRVDDLPGDLPTICKNAIEKTKDNSAGIINMCFNYGGRTEMVDAIKKIISAGINANEVDEDLVKKNLYNGQLPDPDIVVRTSGEKRLSNFLTWETVYSELFFVDKFWPDFTEADAEKILLEFSTKERRFGGDAKKLT